MKKENIKCESCGKIGGWMYKIKLEDQSTGLPTGKTVISCESCIEPVTFH